MNDLKKKSFHDIDEEVFRLERDTFPSDGVVMERIIIECAISLMYFAIFLSSCSIPKPDPIPAQIMADLENGTDWEKDNFLDLCKKGIDPRCEEYQSLIQSQQLAQMQIDEERKPTLRHQQDYQSLVQTQQLAQMQNNEEQNPTHHHQTADNGEPSLDDNDRLMMLAATAGDLDFLKIMLKTGSDPNAENAWRMTALMSASINGQTECVKALLEAGAKPDTQDVSGLTALILASTYPVNLQALRALIKAGADVNIKSKNGATALLNAAQRGCDSCVYELIKAGADVNVSEPEFGFTPLLFAASNGKLLSVRFLVDAGADVNVKSSSDGLTPLMAALTSGNARNMALILLNAGAKSNVAMKDGRNASYFLEHNELLDEAEKEILRKAL